MTLGKVSRKLITMIVGLDIDGVLADFLAPFLQLLENRTGHAPILEESITDFTFSEHPLLSEEIVMNCLEEVSYDPDFWQKLSPLITPGEWQRLDELSREERLFFVTHRYVRETYDSHEITCNWLKMHGISRPVVHFTKESKAPLVQNLGIQFFMDDRWENCRDVAENTNAVVLMPHRPYNRSFQHPSIKRVQEFGELFTHLP